MFERIAPEFPGKEILPATTRTKLSMIVDPPNQPPEVAGERVQKFLREGGSAVLIGGSGFIEPEVFDKTVAAVANVTVASANVPVWILPGHLSQIPKDNNDITGVLNYVHISGSKGNFEDTYPRTAREYVAATLAQRRIPSIDTLYVLCGDPNASVSRVSGILPMDLSTLRSREKLERNIEHQLKNGIDCVFFEAGSNSSEPANTDAVVRVRNLIDTISPSTLLIVSGGIRKPQQAGLFAGIADYVNIGGYFEINGTHDAADFIRALN